MVEKPKKPKTIQDLYPDLSPEEQEEAAYNLRRYIRLAWDIYQRIIREGRQEELRQLLDEAKLREQEREK